MASVVLASGNAGKLKEMRAILGELEVTVRAQSDFSLISPDETGTTFAENAIIKARHAAAGAKMPAIADDSGLIVDALKGEPGVYSARYAGTDASDSDNLELLLERLNGVPEPQRTCRFICVIAVMSHAQDPLPLLSTGVWEGRILDTPRGDNGFGYDPVFFDPRHGCSSAELPASTKNRVSHRAMALSSMLQSLGHKLQC